MIKAFFLDFYGTVVHEDGEVVKKISQLIYETGKAESPSEVDSFWWKDFQNLFNNSYGNTFETQRALEKKSIKHTLEKFASNENIDKLSNYMFEHWVKPPIFEESKKFFEISPLPIYIVSNIDANDVLRAIEFHQLSPSGIFTSEDAKAYKPRKELFELALNTTGLHADEVIHIGDSLSSDVKGASSVGIKAIWLNRFNKENSCGVDSITNLLEALDKLE
ncbi:MULTISPECIES: HAD family hydrolase [Clostridia]|jgi:FMN phosphatase YigB (HAD superfamily)|uniref:HAD family hydrolase n=1 Tax=Clostridia TaxID=186801 RepID=UPI000E50D56A|nr:MULTISPECIES: HAD family hydrolase [Clostridia]RGW91694.1 HAD family hydrolase [Lachnospira eligens]RGZ90914.1 HAD family hydrolase [Eubacterium sp. AM46-8]HBA10587.1 HAD family hydrolase [Eubacterium sp.]